MKLTRASLLLGETGKGSGLDLKLLDQSVEVGALESELSGRFGPVALAP